jgi:hypothetical protein
MRDLLIGIGLMVVIAFAVLFCLCVNSARFEREWENVWRKGKIDLNTDEWREP